LNNWKAHIILILLTFSIFSCDEYSKNKTRDDLGHCIPDGKKAIVEMKWTSERGENFRVKYRILDDDSECMALITSHDFKLIKEGDTLTRKSASARCFKIYGEPCKDAIIDDLKIGLITLLILALVFGVYFGIKYYFGDFIENSVLGQLWVSLKDFINDIVQVNFGVIVWVIVFLISELVLGKVVWMFMQERESKDFDFISLLQTNLAITLIGICLMLINGFSRLHKNIMVLSLGVILIGSLMLFFHYTISLDFTYMIKNVLENTSSN